MFSRLLPSIYADGCSSGRYRYGKGGGGDGGPPRQRRVSYLPLVADVQLAVWRRIRQILSRFAFAKLPDPKSRRGAFLVAGGVVAAGIVVVPVAGIALAIPGLLGIVAGTTLWAIAATTVSDMQNGFVHAAGCSRGH